MLTVRLITPIAVIIWWSDPDASVAMGWFRFQLFYRRKSPVRVFNRELLVIATCHVRIRLRTICKNLTFGITVTVHSIDASRFHTHHATWLALPVLSSPVIRTMSPSAAMAA